MLKLMTQKGLLVSEGYGRGTRYVLPVKGIDVLREEPSNVESSKSANVATSESMLKAQITTNQHFSLMIVFVKQ